MFTENEINLIKFTHLNNSINNLLNKRMQKIRDEVLTGELKIPFGMKRIKILTKTNLNSQDSNAMAHNSVSIENKSNDNKLKMKNGKKYLENKSYLIDSDSSNLKDLSIIKAKNPNFYSPQIFSNKLRMSPIKNPRQQRTFKISEDIERKQKDIIAKHFVKNLNIEKNLRIIREQERRIKLEDQLIKLSDRICKQSPEENDVKNKKENINYSKDSVISKLPLIKNHFSNLKNSSVVKIKEIPKLNSNSKNNSTVRYIEESHMMLDNSASFRSRRKSPYYFNDPKLSKIMEIKNHYKYGNYNLPNNNNNVFDINGHSNYIKILNEGLDNLLIN